MYQVLNIRQTMLQNKIKSYKLKDISKGSLLCDPFNILIVYDPTSCRTCDPLNISIVCDPILQWYLWCFLHFNGLWSHLLRYLRSFLHFNRFLMTFKALSQALWGEGGQHSFRGRIFNRIINCYIILHYV